ncbi:MAG: metal ABC transporter permease, partial [Acidobacteriota bacterium]
MAQLLVGTFLLSLMHALVPNHWVPLVAIGRAEGWSRGETLGMTAVAGAAHTASTILIGVGVGLLGYTLSAHYELITRVVAPAILVGLALVATLVLFKELLFISVDEETARAAGLPAARLRYLLLTLLALTVVSAIKLVGIVLVSAFLVIPAATAQILAPSVRVMMGLSIGFGLT